MYCDESLLFETEPSGYLACCDSGHVTCYDSRTGHMPATRLVLAIDSVACEVLACDSTEWEIFWPKLV